MDIKVVNESSRGLPQELLTAISEFKSFDEVNDIAEAYNLVVRSVKFVYDGNDRPTGQEITVGDRL
jgi:hypothetical protein